MGCRKPDQSRFGIYCWFFAKVIVLGLSCVVSWLSLTPKYPHFTISDVRFTNLINSTNNTMYRNTSIHANTSLILDLEIFNPNKRMGIYYDNISLQGLMYGPGVVGTNSTSAFYEGYEKTTLFNSTSAFYQGYKNTTLFRVLIHVDEGFWAGADGRNFDFMVRVETAVRFRIMKWKTKLCRLKYEARFGNARISLNGTVSGGNYSEVFDASKANTRN